MVNAFNTEQDIKDRLKFLGPNMDQWDLSNRLREANRDAVGHTVNKVEEELKSDRRGQTEFTLRFNEIFKVLRVDWRDEKVPEDDYELVEEPLQPAKIVFSDEYEDRFETSRWRPVVEYIPMDLKDLELLMACHTVILDSSTQTGDEDRKSQEERYWKKIEQRIQRINSKTVNLGSKDRGKTSSSNYNFSGRRGTRYG